VNLKPPTAQVKASRNSHWNCSLVVAGAQRFMCGLQYCILAFLQRYKKSRSQSSRESETCRHLALRTGGAEGTIIISMPAAQRKHWRAGYKSCNASHLGATPRPLIITIGSAHACEMDPTVSRAIHLHLLLSHRTTQVWSSCENFG
jgi:hypothetical protein